MEAASVNVKTCMQPYGHGAMPVDVYFQYRGLIHSQIDAGCKEDATQTCASAIQLAKKKIPSKLIDVLKVQV